MNSKATYFRKIKYVNDNREVYEQFRKVNHYIRTIRYNYIIVNHSPMLIVINVNNITINIINYQFGVSCSVRDM